MEIRVGAGSSVSWRDLSELQQTQSEQEQLAVVQLHEQAKENWPGFWRDSIRAPDSQLELVVQLTQ